MGWPGPWELIIVLLIVVMVFGAKRIPEIMGGLGKGIKTFKKTMESDEPAIESTSETTSEQGKDRPAEAKQSETK